MGQRFSPRPCLEIFARRAALGTWALQTPAVAASVGAEVDFVDAVSANETAESTANNPK